MPWRVQERVRGLAGGLPTRPEPVAEPSGLGRRHSALACVESSTLLVAICVRELGILRL